MKTPPQPIGLFSNLQHEHGFESIPVTGDIADVNGTLYLNGCGIFEQFGQRYDHIFECDGAITAVRFDNGKVYSASKIIKSEGLLEERKVGRHLGSFAAAWPTRFKRMLFGGRKNTSNTNVMPWQGKLYALNEAGKPVEIDPDTLNTVGETSFQSTIKGSFSAHPHRIESRKSLFNYGLTYGKQTKLTVYQLPDVGDASVLCEIPLAHPVMLHDFIVTENHLIFFIPPAKVRVFRMLLALKPFQKNIAWSPEAGTEIIIVPIDQPKNIKRFHTDSFMVFHFAGAFEQDNRLFVDYVWYPDSALLGALGDGTKVSWNELDSQVHGKLHRGVIDLESLHFESSPLWDGNCEYPQASTKRVAGRYNDIWMQSNEEIHGQLIFRLSKLSSDGQLKHIPMDIGQICLEPVLIEGEQNYIASMVFDSNTQHSQLFIINSDTLEVTAKIQMKQAIPLTFHGCWIDSQ
ncbi:carotenoid oxygenase family protein [Arenicella xantha]|uniref:All-trans-8'-apo-beta-carotenal 15,15'-oxygenase n=1 Tax=Arenicella xantha TaxID=644221 RepID=A0A395JR05_9GAMM|nr:carotenoid oxygenase family protein [Arenicella xantha]RBP52762.1 all-trans-8'-apo-beta-carotenal 15,15'-oxygenase [Arenicella xantha]